MFSPDMAFALMAFLGVLFIYMTATQSITIQVLSFDKQIGLESTAQHSMQSLIEGYGEPFNWEHLELIDVNAFGLSKGGNYLGKDKVASFQNQLDNNYANAKQKLGVGGIDLQLNILDANGKTLLTTGQLKTDFEQKIIVERIANYLGKQVIVRGVFTDD